MYGRNDLVPGNMAIDGSAGTTLCCLSATGLSHEMHRNRSGFLKPAASSPMASDVGMAAGAGFNRSNLLSAVKEISILYNQDQADAIELLTTDTILHNIN